MSRTLFCKLATGCCGVALVLGCRHGQHACTDCAPPTAQVGHSLSAAPADPVLAGGVTPPSYRTVPAITLLSSGAGSRPASQALLVASSGPGQAVTNAFTAPSERPRVWAGVAAHPLELTDRSTHAPDYGWLVGYLERNAGRNAWSVRYSSAAADDRHGGSLVLINPGPMSGFRAGQLVRVEGQLIDPLPMELKQAYRVRAIQLLQQ